MRMEVGNGASLGLFCKMKDLKSKYEDSMRFGYNAYNVICKFNNKSSWNKVADKLRTNITGEVILTDTQSRNAGYNENEDFYLTFVYKRYDSQKPQWSEKLDKIEYYINGKLYGYTYYGIDSYDNGCSKWNSNDAHFFLGVSPWFSDGNLYYLKGNVYCTRLYERALSDVEVEFNVEKTQLYRQTLQ